MKTHLLVALLATASLAACGGEEPSKSGASGGTDSADPKKAMLAYAKCMRDNGVDMPDPQFDGNRVMQKGPKNVDRTKMRKADKACASIRDSIKPPEMSDEKKAEFKKAALANAQCMRDQGITNFPDPIFDEDGGAQIRMQKGSGLDPESPKFQKAQKACEKTMPGDVETDGEDG